MSSKPLRTVEHPAVVGRGKHCTWYYSDNDAAKIASEAQGWIRAVQIELLQHTGRPATGVMRENEEHLTLAEKHTIRLLYEHMFRYTLARYRLSRVAITGDMPESTDADAAMRYSSLACREMAEIDKALVKLGLSSTDLAKYRDEQLDQLLEG